jgi:hypothetical protein
VDGKGKIVSVLNYLPCHEDVLGCGSIVLHILEGGEWSALGPLAAGNRAPHVLNFGIQWG